MTWDGSDPLDASELELTPDETPLPSAARRRLGNAEAAADIPTGFVDTLLLEDLMADAVADADPDEQEPDLVDPEDSDDPDPEDTEEDVCPDAPFDNWADGLPAAEYEAFLRGELFDAD